ncbi:futalosine hydrolase [Brevibacillus sp. HB1.2]|uniref:Futalosine hydrolase n=1 Tax=Brevibacillus porteri TaxID=2126350 RepID=A0ABX5FU47_9BACL|nr:MULTISPECIES: futalosine hydrolase [Brevibacillus]MED1797245.1 futalosine hydrolase [Brevibacillus porteri]MED2129315.1 futalosine hydrolase [Brevibacillus porteri]MED2743014.1 futalosine hydrolase [Brevibacillus porteri]MED2817833.1 futalosine hydrolase [Brevibacillus porteri]MED2896891.1 futalosine hydrolase [Brevibacillus porteri]
MILSQQYRSILIVTSVDAERDAVMRGIQGDERFTVIAGGVGPAAAAASTARALACADYDLVICAGICGGFVGEAEIGSLVVATEIICADLGAETPEGFCSVDELGFGSARVSVDQEMVERVTEAMKVAGLVAKKGIVLTLSTVTGTAETAAALAQRMPDALAEAMEGYGVATAAQAARRPVLEIRTVSNAIGPRDKSAWRIKDALESLEKGSSVLREVLS